MTLKSDAKSKNDMRNLDLNFYVSSGKSENSHFDELHLSKLTMFQLKRYTGVTCHDTEE